MVMFNLTYEQAKRLVSRRDFFSMATYSDTSMGARLASAFLITFFMGPMALIVGIGTSISLNNSFGIDIPWIEKLVPPILVVLIGLIIIG